LDIRCSSLIEKLGFDPFGNLLLGLFGKHLVHKLAFLGLRLKASLGLGLGILGILGSLAFLQLVRKLALGKLVAGLEHSILVVELHKQEGLLEPHILEPHILVLHILELHIAELVEHIAELVVSSFGFLVELSIQPLVVHKLKLLELRIPQPLVQLLEL
jgi:hypothetical protein